MQTVFVTCTQTSNSCNLSVIQHPHHTQTVAVTQHTRLLATQTPDDDILLILINDPSHRRPAAVRTISQLAAASTWPTCDEQ
jgi:hypothetical protein